MCEGAAPLFSLRLPLTPLPPLSSLLSPSLPFSLRLSPPSSPHLIIDPLPLHSCPNTPPPLLAHPPLVRLPAPYTPPFRPGIWAFPSRRSSSSHEVRRRHPPPPPSTGCPASSALPEPPLHSATCPAPPARYPSLPPVSSLSCLSAVLRRSPTPPSQPPKTPTWACPRPSLRERPSSASPPPPALPPGGGVTPARPRPTPARRAPVPVHAAEAASRPPPHPLPHLPLTSYHR